MSKANEEKRPKKKQDFGNKRSLNKSQKEGYERLRPFGRYSKIITSSRAREKNKARLPLVSDFAFF